MIVYKSLVIQVLYSKKLNDTSHQPIFLTPAGLYLPKEYSFCRLSIPMPEKVQLDCQ
jgi:hypothetical protein